MKRLFSTILAITAVMLALVFAFTWLNQPDVEELHFAPGRSMTDTGVWEDIEYWVLFRNGSLVNASTGELEENQDILVIGNHIHKIGQSPLLIFDKDLAYNFDCEGRIIIPPAFAVRNQIPGSIAEAGLDEGKPADLLIINGTTREALQSFLHSGRPLSEATIQEHAAILLVMTGGVITKDELANKRIDASRLHQAIRRRRP